MLAKEQFRCVGEKGMASVLTAAQCKRPCNRNRESETHGSAVRWELLKSAHFFPTTAESLLSTVRAFLSRFLSFSLYISLLVLFIVSFRSGLLLRFQASVWKASRLA